MITKSFICLILICLCVFTACTKIEEKQKMSPGVSSAQLLRTKQPNIIFILGDDIGYEIPTCNGGQSYSTPNIDILAAKGVRYNQCYALPNCSPSRVELLTGKYNFRNYTMWGILDTTQRTMGNLMKQAGYATCVAGKWQLDGGAASAQKFGFDEHCLFLPFFTVNETTENRYRYKNPHIYQNGAYLPDSFTNGKYADDIFTQFICDFIDSNRQHPFFVYYPLSLCHQPFSPPPTNPDYATWNPLTDGTDPKYFPSMVNYMDKKIGQIISKIYADDLGSNTIIIFAGDNGTPKDITSKWNGQLIKGGKGQTNVYATHVPLIISQLSNNSRAGSTANTLIDFTDFLPTFADIAKTKITSRYGTTDGVSFYKSLQGTADSIRSSVFFYWKDIPGAKAYRWAQTINYKQYDSSRNYNFYNFAADPREQKPIPKNKQTPQQKSISTQLSKVLDSLQ